MKNGSATISLLLFILAVSALVGLGYLGDKTAKEKEVRLEQYKIEVQEVVSEFGNKMKMVSLLSPSDVLARTMDENYSGLVAPELITEWTADPSKALGRITSSPWPEKIEIQSARKINPSTYEVKGKILEKTSVELADAYSGGYEATFYLKNRSGNWLITSFSTER